MSCSHLVPLLTGDVQVPLAADHRLVKAPQDLQCVPKVAAGFSLPYSVAYGPVTKWVMKSKTSKQAVKSSAYMLFILRKSEVYLKAVKSFICLFIYLHFYLLGYHF